MFFTRIGMIAAWLVFLGGIARLTMGLVVAFRLYPAQYDASRYIGSATPGRVIDQGLLVIVAGIALGILVEISRSVRRKD